MLKSIALASCLLALAAAPAGAADHYRALYAFQGATDGGMPRGSLVRDAAGNFYGATITGGEGPGTVFKLSPQGVETTLYAFHDSDGVGPQGPLLLDAEGALFGTTATGGGTGCNGVGCGVAFAVAPDGSESTLHVFKLVQGIFPAGGLVADAAGNLTGTLTQYGPTGAGTIFRLSPQGKFRLLHAFDPDAEGSYSPHGLVADPKGNLYGTTSQGGPTNLGAIFRYAPDGIFTVLHNFSSEDGSNPGGRLTLDRHGNLYGVLAFGGAGGKGSIFRLARDGTFTTLYSFTGGADGQLPVWAPILDGKGNIYGTLRRGPGDGMRGAECEDGCGAVYKLAADGTLSVLHAFANDAGGYYPMGDLLLDRHRLYGATLSGGLPGEGCGDGCGVIYEIPLK